MRIDIDPSKLNEDEGALVRLMHRLRALAAASLIGGIAVIAVIADPGVNDGQQATVRDTGAAAAAPGRAG